MAKRRRKNPTRQDVKNTVSSGVGAFVAIATFFGIAYLAKKHGYIDYGTPDASTQPLVTRYRN